MRKKGVYIVVFFEWGCIDRLIGSVNRGLAALPAALPLSLAEWPTPLITHTHTHAQARDSERDARHGRHLGGAGKWW